MSERMRKTGLSLRFKLAFGSIVILCASCGLAYLMVYLGFSYLYSGPITSSVALLLALATCTPTMIIGGIALWHSAAYVTNPIAEISEGVQRVADGDFTVRLSFDSIHRKRQSNAKPDEIEIIK